MEPRLAITRIRWARVLRCALAFLTLVPAVAPAVVAADAAKRPVDLLLRLVPSDVAAVITVEGLRDQARAFSVSRLAGELRELPAVKAWFGSERFQQFERSRLQIEALLGSSVGEIRDEVLGDAIVLALRLPADAPAEPASASGVLLLQARDQAVLKRIVRVINTAQQESGELARVGDVERNGTTYHVREFPAGASRLPEWYVIYPDGTFAISHSEALIQAVMDRKRQTMTSSGGLQTGAVQAGEDERGMAARSGLDSLSKLQALQRRQPERALARLFVDPRPFARLIAASVRAQSPAQDKLLAMLERYLAAVDYAGAAITWSEQSIQLRTVEILDPSKLDPWIMHWAGDARPLDFTLDRLPPTAIAKISLHADAAALFEAIRLGVPDRDQPRLANFETILSGLLLGQDLKASILPALGPRAIAYLDAPDDLVDEITSLSPKAPRPFPLRAVLVVGIEGRGGGIRPPGESPDGPAATQSPPAAAVDAVDNALRTFLALLALDQNRAQGRAKIVSRTVGDVAIRTLDCPIAFAYAVDRSSPRLIVSTSADAIARYLEHAANPGAATRFDEIRASGFANSQTFACIDLGAISGLASRHHDQLVRSLAASQGRPVSDVDRDLTQALGIARLIDAVFLTTRIEPQATVVERSLGILLRPREVAPRSKP